MPKFTANLTMLFTKQPFLDRFAAASHAGFRAVEFLFPSTNSWCNSDGSIRPTSRLVQLLVAYTALARPIYLLFNAAQLHRLRRGRPAS